MPDPNVQWTGVLQWRQFANSFTVSTTRVLTVPATVVTGRVVTMFALLSTTSFGIGGVIGTRVTDSNGVAVPFAESQQFNGNCSGILLAVPNWPAALGGQVAMDVLTTNGAAAGVMLGAIVASNAVMAVDYNVNLSAASTTQVASLGIPMPSYPALHAAGVSGLNTAGPPGGPALGNPLGLDPDWPVAISSNFNEPRSVFGTYYVSGALSTYTGALRSVTVTPTWDLGVVTPWATNGFTTAISRTNVQNRPFAMIL